MTLANSPNHMQDDFPLPWSLNVKIELFADRILGWQLLIAKELRDKISNSDIAVLLITICYIEMIGKFYNGYSGRSDSMKYFKEGLVIIFPEIDKVSSTFMQDIYQDIRNGLYHRGLFSPRVLLTSNSQSAIGLIREFNIIGINPGLFIEHLIVHFNSYIDLLKDDTNLQLRQNFEKSFDSMHGSRSEK